MTPSVWGSTQDLSSWGIHDHKTGEDQLTVAKKTIGNTLHRNGLKSCSAHKDTLLRKAHVQARLNSAHEHLDDSENAWLKVMCSDETKISIKLFGFNSTRRLWRKRNSGYDPKNSIPTVKHGGGSFML